MVLAFAIKYWKHTNTLNEYWEIILKSYNVLQNSKNITEYHASQSLKALTKFLLLKVQENCGRGALLHTFS